MSTVELGPNQWTAILQFLRRCPEVYVGQEKDCRRFLNGMLWMARSGAPWRLLPERYGKWNRVYKRFLRWCEKGIWERMAQRFADDPDMEHVLVDSSAVRAHPCAAGAPRKRGAKRPKDWGGVGAALQASST